MKVDIDTAEEFKTSFRNVEHLRLGRNALFEVGALEFQTEPPDDRERGLGVESRLTITATVRLTVRAKVTHGLHHVCHVCGAQPPAPSTYDALWYILENHQDE